MNKILIQFTVGYTFDQASDALNRMRDLILTKEEGNQATISQGRSIQIRVTTERLVKLSQDLVDRGFTEEY